MELEEAGEKWRAGDAAKSMRFFMRAISNYDEGLQKHPAAFDLAYNKYVIILDLLMFNWMFLSVDVEISSFFHLLSNMISYVSVSA